jgi:acetylornithine deacetylase
VSEAAGRLDSGAIARDASALVQVPSVTGDERAALERLGELAAALGLRPELHRHDLGALRAHPEHPGEEAPRDELWGLTVTVPGTREGAPRLALDGHVDVVGAGTLPWAHGPWSGAVEDGFVHGRGSVDMKGGVVAALHALAAVAAAGGGTAPHGEVVLVAVGSEEDGGLGTFAALERDDRFDACLIPEATGFDVVCAQAGALTFEGVVRGVSAHAAHRLEGVSAIDRYLPVHAALAEHERRVNTGVEHELMRALELPYPVLVGRLAAGEWSSQVPDRLRFEGRAPVRVGEPVAAARAAVEAAVARTARWAERSLAAPRADGQLRFGIVQAAVEAAVAAATPPGGPPVELRWSGGQFASGETPTAHPFAQLVARSVEAERGRPARFAGVPWGADMRLWTARGIPTVMAGTSGIERAHAVDERVSIAELHTLARAIVRVIEGCAAMPVSPATR